MRLLPDKVEAIRAYSRPNTVKQLRQFLGMVNFFSKVLPKAAENQAPLSNLLQGNARAKTPVEWTPAATQAFETCKESLAEATLLAHTNSGATLAIFSDASDHALKQFVDGAWQPLDFFSKKLSLAESTYGAYDCELLAVYLAVKYFRHMVEGRSFTVYTDHKPITYAFRKKNQQCSPRQFRLLDFISEFTTDILHIFGEDNIVADALSRINELESTLNYEALAPSQQEDDELQSYRENNSALQLRLVHLPDTKATSTRTARPFITKPFRKAAFNTVHRLSHPEANATLKLVTQCYESMKSDCRLWVRNARSQKSHATFLRPSAPFLRPYSNTSTSTIS